MDRAVQRARLPQPEEGSLQGVQVLPLEQLEQLEPLQQLQQLQCRLLTLVVVVEPSSSRVVEKKTAWKEMGVEPASYEFVEKKRVSEEMVLRQPLPSYAAAPETPFRTGRPFLL